MVIDRALEAWRRTAWHRRVQYNLAIVYARGPADGDLAGRELNLLGRVTRRRRDAPVLPPVGGSRGTVVSPVVARWVADHVEYPALADDLAPAASVDLPEPTPAVVTSWVARETELLLATAPAGDGDEALRTEFRRRQLRDAAVDRIALAVALKNGPDRVSVEEHALRVISALGRLTL